MDNTPRKIGASIRSVYIFNPTYGQEERQENEKILYYYPKEIDINAKIRDVGLSQAFTAFTDSFTDKPGECEVIHTEKTTQLLYQPEPNYWMVLVLNVPKEIHSKDGVEYPEYHTYELHDSIYRHLLIQMYNLFRLRFGTFEMFTQVRDPRTEFESFFDEVHNFIDLMKATFPKIRDASFFYNKFVVDGGKIEPNNLFTLHKYIYQNLNGCIEIAHPVYLQKNGKTQHFLMLLLSTAADGPELVDPEVLCPESSGCTEGARLCIFLDSMVTDEQIDDYLAFIHYRLCDLAKEFYDFTNKQTSSLKASSVASSIDCVNNAECMSPKYIFVNDQNLRLGSNLYNDTQRRAPLPQNVTNLIVDLFNSNHNKDDKTSYEEVMIKSTDDFWIVKRRFNCRQRFVVIFSQKATLLDVTKEAERIFEQEIKDGVFADK